MSSATTMIETVFMVFVVSVVTSAPSFGRSICLDHTRESHDIHAWLPITVGLVPARMLPVMPWTSRRSPACFATTVWAAG